MSPQQPFFRNCDLDIRPLPSLMTLNMVPKEKDLVTRYTHVKYEGPKSYQSKDMTNVKVFADKQTDARTKGQMDQRTNDMCSF